MFEDHKIIFYPAFVWISIIQGQGQPRIDSYKDEAGLKLLKRQTAAYS